MIMFKFWNTFIVESGYSIIDLRSILVLDIQGNLFVLCSRFKWKSGSSRGWALDYGLEVPGFLAQFQRLSYGYFKISYWRSGFYEQQ